MFVVIYDGDNGLETFGPFDDFNSAKAWITLDSAKTLQLMNSAYTDINETENSLTLIKDNDSKYTWTISKVFKPLN